MDNEEAKAKLAAMGLTNAQAVCVVNARIPGHTKILHVCDADTVNLCNEHGIVRYTCQFKDGEKVVTFDERTEEEKAKHAILLVERMLTEKDADFLRNIANTLQRFNNTEEEVKRLRLIAGRIG